MDSAKVICLVEGLLFCILLLSTPLLCTTTSTSSSCTGVMKLLIERGADVNALNNRKETPLHLAAKIDNLQGAKCLVESGADMTIKDIDNKIAVIYAIDNGYEKMAIYLANQMAKQICKQ